MSNKNLKDPTKKSSNAPYLWVVVSVFFIAVVGAISLEYLRPDKDNSALLIQIFGLAVLIIPVVMTFIQSRETHRAVNSDLARWIDDAVQRAFAEGEKSGSIQANKRTDMLEEQKKTDSTML